MATRTLCLRVRYRQDDKMMGRHCAGKWSALIGREDRSERRRKKTGKQEKRRINWVEDLPTTDMLMGRFLHFTPISNVLVIVLDAWESGGRCTISTKRRCLPSKLLFFLFLLVQWANALLHSLLWQVRCVLLLTSAAVPRQMIMFIRMVNTGHYCNKKDWERKRASRCWAVSRKTFSPSGERSKNGQNECEFVCLGAELTCAVAIKNGPNYKGTLAQRQREWLAGSVKKGHPGRS